MKRPLLIAILTGVLLLGCAKTDHLPPAPQEIAANDDTPSDFIADGRAIPQAAVASEPQPDQRPGKADRDQKTKDIETVLNLVIHDVLNNPNLQHSREFYGTPGVKKAVLVPGSKGPMERAEKSPDGKKPPLDKKNLIEWPKDWTPNLPGWDFQFAEDEECQKSDPKIPRLLGIRLDKLDLDLEHKKEDSFDSAIEVTVFCIRQSGGSSLVIGGCHIHYNVERQGDKWVIVSGRVDDP